MIIFFFFSFLAPSTTKFSFDFWPLVGTTHWNWIFMFITCKGCSQSQTHRELRMNAPFQPVQGMWRGGGSNWLKPPPLYQHVVVLATSCSSISGTRPIWFTHALIYCMSIMFLSRCLAFLWRFFLTFILILSLEKNKHNIFKNRDENEKDLCFSLLIFAFNDTVIF